MAHHDKGTGHRACEEAILYRYCGDHWAASALPVPFKVNTAGAPDGALAAVRAAAATWDGVWRAVPPVTDDTGDCVVLCYDGETAKAGGFNGINQVVWGVPPPEECLPASEAWLATACLSYEGDTGHAAHHIVEFDVYLSPDVRWRVPATYEIPVGEVSGLYPGLGCYQVYALSWFDVEATATHELGHAIGLDDVGDGTYPEDLTDASFSQTMYRKYFPCSTNKRTPEAGDLAAVSRAKAETYRDKG